MSFPEVSVLVREIDFAPMWTVGNLGIILKKAYVSLLPLKPKAI